LLEISGYFIDFKEAISKIKKERYNKIAIQVPEGLKREVLKIVDFLEEETKATFIISGDPCFGACDLIDKKLKNLGIECIIHIGHLPFVDTSFPTIFVNALSTVEVSEVVKKSIPFLVGKDIGIVTTAQHVHKLGEIKEILQKNSFNPIISEGDARIPANGLILGCNFSVGAKKEVDSFLFVGSGTFHPLGLSLSSAKPVIAADPFTKKVKKLDEIKEKILRQRYGAIAVSKDANTFGILLSTKPGQQRLRTVNRIKEMLNRFNRKSYIITMDYFLPSSLMGLGIDCFVSTGCPRIAIDDYLQYEKPILTPLELEIVLGERKWEDYEFDQI
jgi:2-(3-amino-3-carboxypropyl)histidine synthase